MLKHLEAERLQSRTIPEEDWKVLEEQIDEKQREAARDSEISSAVPASVAVTRERVCLVVAAVLTQTVPFPEHVMGLLSLSPRARRCWFQ